jgi:hypothetical protein
MSLTKALRILLGVLLVLELVFILATTPATMPHNPELTALFNKWKLHPTDENKSAFRAAMDRALEPDRQRQRIAVCFVFMNGTGIYLLYRKLKRLETTS